MKPWLFVLGTRPEAIKLAPMLRAFMKRSLPFRVIATGQHTDLFEQTGFADEFPVEHLNLPSANDPLAYVQMAQNALGASVGPDLPRGLIVQGDTASAVAGGRWARLAGIPMAHVEAGLRSGHLNDPWPEERFRIELDCRSTWLFAPSALALQHLLDMRSYQKRAQVFLVGNTVVDALLETGIAPVKPSARDNRVLVTLHRRESFGAPMAEILSGLIRAAIQFPTTQFLWPLHPNPQVSRVLLGTNLPANLRLAAPLGYREFLGLLAASRACLTDSGGVVEEACTLGVPTAIARDHTERQEAIAAGSAILAHRTSDTIATAIATALTMHPEPSNTFGDGHAASRIADVLQSTTPR